MSFIISVYVPEGIVMAADSRQSVSFTAKTPEGKDISGTSIVSSDFVYKLFMIEEKRVGISSCGEAVLGGITVEGHVKRFLEEALEENDDVISIPVKLKDFIREKFPNANTTFHVAGFRKEGKTSVPYVFVCHIGRNEQKRMNFHDNDNRVIYGSTWSGEIDIISGIFKSGMPFLWDAMPIQDAIDFAIYAVRTTADTMRFQARPKTVGGPIDVLLITPEKASWIQRKEFHGEAGKASS